MPKKGIVIVSVFIVIVAIGAFIYSAYGKSKPAVEATPFERFLQYAKSNRQEAEEDLSEDGLSETYLLFNFSGVRWLCRFNGIPVFALFVKLLVFEQKRR